MDRQDETSIREMHMLNPSREIPTDTLSGTDTVQLLKFVAALRHEREALGLSLEQIAERAGVDVLILSHLESGHGFNPTISTLFRLAASLGKKLTLGLEELSSS